MKSPNIVRKNTKNNRKRLQWSMLEKLRTGIDNAEVCWQQNNDVRYLLIKNLLEQAIEVCPTIEKQK